MGPVRKTGQRPDSKKDLGPQLIIVGPVSKTGPRSYLKKVLGPQRGLCFQFTKKNNIKKKKNDILVVKIQ